MFALEQGKVQFKAKFAIQWTGIIDSVINFNENQIVVINRIFDNSNELLDTVRVMTFTENYGLELTFSLKTDLQVDFGNKIIIGSSSQSKVE